MMEQMEEGCSGRRKQSQALNMSVTSDVPDELLSNAASMAIKLL
jgi:hypothetical protein